MLWKFSNYYYEFFSSRPTLTYEVARMARMLMYHRYSSDVQMNSSWIKLQFQWQQQYINRCVAQKQQQQKKQTSVFGDSERRCDAHALKYQLMIR